MTNSRPLRASSPTLPSPGDARSLQAVGAQAAGGLEVDGVQAAVVQSGGETGGRDGGALAAGGLEEGGVQTTGRRSDVALAVDGSEGGEESHGDQQSGRPQTGDGPTVVDSDGNGARPRHPRKAKK